MTNMRNFGIAEGRVTRDPKFLTNKDGSRKVLITIAAENNFTNKDGKREVEFVPLEGFIPEKKGNNGVFDLIHKGDMIGVCYRVKTNRYTQDGQDVYRTVLAIQDVDLKESKSVTTARAAKNGAAEAEAPAPEMAPEIDGSIQEDLPFAN